MDTKPKENRLLSSNPSRHHDHPVRSSNTSLAPESSCCAATWEVPVWSWTPELAGPQLVGGTASCLATLPTFLGHSRNGLKTLYASLAKIKSDCTFEECRRHAYISCMSICKHAISKDAEKNIEKPSDDFRNCLSLKGRAYLLYTYSSGGQYATHSLETQDISFPWFDAALVDFFSHFTFPWFPFLCSALTMLAP